MAETRVIFGYGYLGRRVGALWSQKGDHVIAVSRQGLRSPEPTPDGVADMATVPGDVTKPETLGWLGAAPSLGGSPPVSLLYAVGHDRSAAPDIFAVYAGGLRNVLDALPGSVTRAVYISTTGVYGLHAGEWVDESTPPDPQRDGGRASLAAEQALAAHGLGRRSAILRLAGLYGPGRVPHLDRLRSGEPLPVPGEGWLNLIHVDDAARVVVAVEAWLAARDAADGPHVFCVSDGAPVRRADYYAEVARLLGAPPPQFEPPEPDAPSTRRAAASRRVRNDKLRRTLGVSLAYPNYRAGLAAILAAE